MTEAEARVVGASANRIVNLRGMIADRRSVSGNLTVPVSSGTVAMTLTAEDVRACLALLIERETALLIGFDIELETPAR